MDISMEAGGGFVVVIKMIE